MKIRLDPEDCARLGVPEVIDFDDSTITLREAAALQKITGLHPEDMFKAFNNQEIEAMLAMVWLVVGRELGKRPDWDTFDLKAGIGIEGDPEDPGKETGSDGETTSSN